MTDYLLFAPDEATMLSGLLAAGLATQEDETITPISASHRHDLFVPHTVVLTPAVIAEDGTVVEDAVLVEGYHAILRDRGLNTLAVWQALDEAGVTMSTDDGKTFKAAGDGPTFAELQAAKLNQLGAVFRAKRDAGLVVADVTYSTKPDAIQELSELVKYLSRAGGTMAFRTRSGAIVEGVGLAEATVIYEAVTNRQAALQADEVLFAKAILAANTEDDLDAIDLTTGWSA